MRIGILTFHSQLNYGGVLQCFALQSVLRSMGHAVYVLDRWLDPDNETLVGCRRIGLRQFAVFARDLMRLNGVLFTLIRRRKTMAFIRKYINLTDYHFHKWQQAPKSLGVDFLVVGSDQVWNCAGPKDPSVYLLRGAPPVRSIAYAASIGMTGIPDTKKYMYREGLRHFIAISVRENKAKELLQEFHCDVKPDIEKVLDPAALLADEQWEASLSLRRCHHRKPHMMCYFIGVKVEDVIDKLDRFAKQHDAIVEMYCSSPGDIRGVSLWRKLRSALKGRVRLMLRNGPREFLESVLSADWVLTDSFHAVVFSALFGKNVRVLAPQTEIRRMMFSRIEELEEWLSPSCDFICKDVESALASFVQKGRTAFDKARMAQRRKESISWLRRALTLR